MSKIGGDSMRCGNNNIIVMLKDFVSRGKRAINGRKTMANCTTYLNVRSLCQTSIISLLLQSVFAIGILKM